MKAIRRRLRILFFLLGLIGLIGTALPATAEELGAPEQLIDASEETQESAESTLEAETLAVDPVGGGGASETRAVITASAERLETLTAIAFDASSSTIQSGSLAGYSWDLDGDGLFEKSTIESTVTHVYTQDGVVSVRVKILTDEGPESISEPLSIEVLNRAPSASFSISTAEPTNGAPVTFTDMSSDRDGSVHAWFWNFGDGSISSDQHPVHTFDRAETFLVTLFVIDDDGRASGAVTHQVTIENAAPIAAFGVPTTTLLDTPVSFTNESIDPGTDGRIVHTAWDFGDGTYIAGGPNATGIYVHTYAEPGTYTVALFVIDQDGLLSVARRQIHVVGVI